MDTIQKIEKTVLFNKPVEEVFDFHCYLGNLIKIMPDNIRLNIVKAPEEAFNVGDRIRMWITFYYLPVYWESEITEFTKNKIYADSQKLGPFTFWNHYHIFEPEDNGTLMTDRIEYQLPCNFLGELADVIFLKNELEKLFDARHKNTQELFNKI